MEALIACLCNWKTTVVGFVAGIALYVVANGVKLPSNAQEWWTFAFAALVAGLGFVAKDATTGSRPALILLPLLALALTGCAFMPAMYVKCSGKGAITGTASLGGGLMYGGGGTNTGTLQADCGDGFEYYRGPKPKNLPAEKPTQ